jgi:hypothetical protein
MHKSIHDLDLVVHIVQVNSEVEMLSYPRVHTDCLF